MLLEGGNLGLAKDYSHFNLLVCKPGWFRVHSGRGLAAPSPSRVAAALSPSELRHSALRTQNTSQDKVLTLVKLLLLLYPAVGNCHGQESTRLCCRGRSLFPNPAGSPSLHRWSPHSGYFICWLHVGKEFNNNKKTPTKLQTTRFFELYLSEQSLRYLHLPALSFLGQTISFCSVPAQWLWGLMGLVRTQHSKPVRGEHELLYRACASACPGPSSVPYLGEVTASCHAEFVSERPELYLSCLFFTTLKRS